MVPPKGQDQTEARDSLRWALGALGPEYREVVELHWFAGLSFEEVAEVMGITRSTAKVRAHRAYSRLRQVLSEDLPNPEKA
jgi:RNA polymerase sigma-70 factor (ECF subfamily)